MPLETGVIGSLLFQMIGYELKVYCGMVNTLTIINNAKYAIKKQMCACVKKGTLRRDFH